MEADAQEPATDGAPEAAFDPFAELRREFRDVREDLEELRLLLPRPLRSYRWWARPWDPPPEDDSLVVVDMGDGYEVHWDYPRAPSFRVECRVQGQELWISPARGAPSPRWWPLRRAESATEWDTRMVSFSAPVNGELATVRVEGGRVDVWVPKRRTGSRPDSKDFRDGPRSPAVEPVPQESDRTTPG